MFSRIHILTGSDQDGHQVLDIDSDLYTSLRSALGLQRDLQDKLQGTEQDRDLLQLRCHDLSDELERLGQMQADLMGHANEGQRISYMEGMRREMAIVKHVRPAYRHYRILSDFRAYLAGADYDPTQP